MKINATGIALFMTSDETKRLKLIKDFKFNESDEAIARRKYYSDATILCKRGVKFSRPLDWYFEQSGLLREKASKAEKPLVAKKFVNNASAVEAWGNNFRNRTFTIIDRPPKYVYTHAGLLIPVLPDMYVQENGKEKMIKLDFSKDPQEESYDRIMCQMMFEAAHQCASTFPISSFIYCDVRRGIDHAEARVRSRLSTNIKSVCKTIVALWDTI